MRYIAICTVIAVGLLLVAGCSKPTVVGKWKFNRDNVDFLMEFKPDNTTTLTSIDSSGSPTDVVKGTGTWKITGEGDDMSIALTQGLTVSGKPVPYPDQTGKVKFEKDKFTISVALGSTTVEQVFTKVQ
jgi:hypothetical protein